VVSLVGDVCLEMEQRGLSFIRNTTKYIENGMPWVKDVLQWQPKTLTVSVPVTSPDKWEGLLNT